MYKTQTSRVFALFALLAMLSGCGEKEITGQIFVVTQAKANIKLALVAVGAIPQEEFDSFLKAKQSERQDQQGQLSSKYNIARTQQYGAMTAKELEITYGNYSATQKKLLHWKFQTKKKSPKLPKQ